MSRPRLARPHALKPSPLYTRKPQLPPRLSPSPRNASSNTTTTDDKPALRPLVLAQPDRFRPPSHGARRPRKPRHFGPSLTEEEIKAQATKRYPHTLPPEGTVMRRFLESRGIHVWITMSVLVSMTGFVILTDFKTKNKFPELLPPGSMFWSQPVSYVRQYFAVYKLHSEAYMAEQQEKRARQLDEARKRKEYLIAHGIEKEGLFGFGTVEGDMRKERRRREQQALEEASLDLEHADSVKAGGSSSARDVLAEQARLEQQNANSSLMGREGYSGTQRGALVGHDGKTPLHQVAPDGKEQGGATAEKAKKWFGIW